MKQYEIRAVLLFHMSGIFLQYFWRYLFLAVFLAVFLRYFWYFYNTGTVQKRRYLMFQIQNTGTALKLAIPQCIDGKSTLSQQFSVTNLGSPDRVWSCPDFPNSWRKIHPQPAIFRHKFGKPWSCLILSSPDRVWSWSECDNSWRRRRRRRRTKRISKG